MFREKRQIFLVLVIFLILNQLISYFVIRSTVTANLASAQRGVSLNKANRSTASISVWANTAAVDIFSYNYSNIDARFNAISRYFTLDQWKSYSAQIKASGAFDNVKKLKMLVGAVATGPVEIIHQGVVKGSYQWTVKVPLLVVYTTADKKAQQQLNVEMVIARQPDYINASGLAINQFSAAEANTDTASTKSSS
jgi:hypothetical protein